MAKTCVVVVSGTLERIQMAAMVASVAAVSGHETLVFLTMNALTYFTRGSQTPAPPEGAMGHIIATKNVPPFRNLFEQAVELGEARVYPCSMAMDVLQLEAAELESWLQPPTGLTKFLADAQDGQVWTF